MGRILILGGTLTHVALLVVPEVRIATGIRGGVWFVASAAVLLGAHKLGWRPGLRPWLAGYCVLFCALILNEWTLGVLDWLPVIGVTRLPPRDIEVIAAGGRFVVRATSTVGIVCGVLLIQVRAQFKHLVLVMVSLLMFLALLELTLRSGWFDQLDRPDARWIPPRYASADVELNRQYREEASRNEFGFRDRFRTNAKLEGRFRVAVLGDSVVWGHGLPQDEIWSAKLEQRLLQADGNTELLSWGLPGWSTRDEFTFLHRHGSQYEIDLLIVGFVTNDPALGDIQMKRLVWHERMPALVRHTIPNTVAFLGAHINENLIRFALPDWGYTSWEESLYSDANLAQYRELLTDLATFCDEQEIELLFVLTADNIDPSLAVKHAKIIPLLETVGINYLDLYPALLREFGEVNPRILWANPGNSHPGPRITRVFADEVFAYLETNHALP